MKQNEATLALLIGGMRCGSTGIYVTLSQHSEIVASKVKEPGFFSSDREWEKGFSYYFNNWPSFDSTKHKVLFEATTHYSKFPVHKNVPSRIAQSPCRVKILYSVRDPLDRIESHLAFQVGKGYLNSDKREEFLLGSALSYSSYWLQISKYLESFKEDDIFIFVQEDFKERPEDYFRSMFEFLDINREEKISIRLTNSRKGYIEQAANKSPNFSIILTPEEEKLLANKLVNDIIRFEREFSIDTSSWSRFWKFRQH